MDHLKGMLFPELRVKTEDPFFGQTTVYGKMPTFLENFMPFLAKKLCTQVPTWP